MFVGCESVGPGQLGLLGVSLRRLTSADGAGQPGLGAEPGWDSHSIRVWGVRRGTSEAQESPNRRNEPRGLPSLRLGLLSTHSTPHFA